MQTAPRPKVTPFLMFTGEAERAMSFYASLFDDATIEAVSRYGPGEGGAEGTVRHATFSLGGQRFMCIDSPPQHAFGFTPSFSIYVECASRAEIDRLFAALADGGQQLMPLDSYGFSARFGWLTDRFGVSWQLNLAGDPSDG